MTTRIDQDNQDEMVPARDRMPLVSVMMPAYNAGIFIGQAIESVLTQTYPHWELVIVDDGSTDGTSKVIERYVDRRIKVISQLNRGEATARNVALEAVQGEYLAFLDADDMWLPDHLEQAVSYLVNHPDADAVYTDGHYCDQDGNLLRTLSSLRRGPFEGRLFEQLVRASDVFGPPTCVVLIRHLIQQHDLTFDPGIVIGPDWDFMTRYAEHACFGYVDQPTCLYRVHQTNITKTTKSEQRALSLAKCRENAIRLKSFSNCPADIRVYVFYDLLLNLLTGFPERQMELTRGEGFSKLPLKEQSRLLRLMASKAMVSGIKTTFINDWIDQSRILNPSDPRGALIKTCYSVSPSLCASIMRWREISKKKNYPRSLFGDLRY